MPDGTLNIATESKDKHIVRDLILFGSYFKLIASDYRKRYFVGTAKVDCFTNKILSR